MTSYAQAVLPARPLLVAAALSLLIGLAASPGLTVSHPGALPQVGSGAAPRDGLSRLPAAALGPVSAALGADRRAYRVSGSRGVLLASDPAQRLHARFDRLGVQLRSGNLHVGLALRAIGYGRALAPVGGVAPRATANRVTYARPGLGESYANGPLGVEQGFSLARPPASRTGGSRQPLTLALALSGNGRAALAAGGRAITLTHGSGSLRYDGLAASDASGRALHSWLELRADTVLIRVDARHARYPLRIDPLVQLGEKLVGGSEEEGPGKLGTSVALSGDGRTALIGAPSDEDTAKGETLVGAAWVFTRTGSIWTQQGPKLRGEGRSGKGQFGLSVALSSDGNTALIGGIGDLNEKSEAVGAAWVFTRVGGVWTQQGSKLTGGSEETAEGQFGRSVALSADGNTALVGANFNESNKGAAWVFTRAGSIWTRQEPELTGGAEEEGEAQFGLSVALSADGNTALIGGPGDEGGKATPMAGAAWVFTRSTTTWSQPGSKLTGGTEEISAGKFGSSVALSGDGDTALAGAPADAGNGGVWAFTHTGSSWSQQGPKLTPSDASGSAAFGAGVALSADGNGALIGGPNEQHGGIALAGGLWEFARAGATWTQQEPKLEGDGTESEFGLAVALSSDGDTALTGGPVDNVDTGAAWAFVDPPPTVTTNAAAAVGAMTATIKGTVNAGASNVVRFQFGSTTAYGSQTSKLSLPPSSTARGIGATLTNLTPGATYHFRLITENSAGANVGADQAFTTTAGAPGATPPGATVTAISTPTAVRPIISSFKQSHSRWRAGSMLARISATVKPQAPLGTTFGFKLNEAASIVFKFTQPAIGRKVNGKCIAQTNSNRAKHACKRMLTRGTLSFAAHAGAVKVAFQGALSRSKKLKPGSYTCVMTATSLGLRSAPKSLSFTIVK